MTDEYSLHANACIDLIRGRNLKIRQHFTEAVHAGHGIHVSSIVLHELSFGAGRSQNPEPSRNALEIFITGIAILDFDGDDAFTAGEIRAHLSKIGKTIGPFDILIAAQALRRKLILVTDNIRDFKRVPGLLLENWSK